MAAVVRFYGVKGACSRRDKSEVKSPGSTRELHLKLFPLGVGEVIGIPCVAVKCVVIRKNTSGEGGLLDDN